jgi:hypothetical protein
MSKRSKIVTPASVAPTTVTLPESDPAEPPHKANRQMMLWLLVPAIVIVVGVIVDKCRG